MALASQTTRSSTGRGQSSNQGGLGRFRRRKARARRRNFTILIIVVLAGFWWLVLRNPETTPSLTVAADNAAQEQAAESKPASSTTDPLRSAMSGNQGITMPEPTRSAPEQQDRTTRTEGVSANKPISVITMGERPNSGSSPGSSMGDSISDAIDRAQGDRRDEPELTQEPETPIDQTPALASMISRAESAVSRNRLVEARTLYNAALLDPNTDGASQGMLRRRITALNDTLLFSPTINENDPYTSRYQIESGDALSKLPRKLGLNVNWRFIQRINGISDPKRIRVGQRVKTVTGPFHAIISKSAYRMDLYMGESSELMYVCSFPVGLGENDSTPIGAWVVRKDSKLVNPRWVNPRTHEVFGADDPLNPIGERWIGIEGVDDQTRSLEGFGIHGTVDPESIGTQASMGCVRLGDDDVALVYELLIEGVSRVAITP